MNEPNTLFRGRAAPADGAAEEGGGVICAAERGWGTVGTEAAVIAYDPVKRRTCNHTESVYEELGRVAGVRWVRWACADCGSTINQWSKGRGEHDLPPEHREMWLTPAERIRSLGCLMVKYLPAEPRVDGR